VLCLLAALRVFVFSAGFPLFNNVDEALHTDLVSRYARGDLTRGLGPFLPEVARQVAIYGSPEFLANIEAYPGGRVPKPLWKLSPQEGQVRREARLRKWSAIPNFEASQPPLYYALAGAWLWFGRALGLGEGPGSVYWVRFLNVPLAALLVLLSLQLGRRVLERESDVYAAGLLVAVLPQDSFYSIQNDVLSPLVVGGMCLALWSVVAHRVSPQRGLLLGVTIAATGLTKLSNLPFLVVVGLAVAALFFRNKPRARSEWLGWAPLFASATLPLAALVLWNAHAFGDWLGAAEKVRLLGWTKKPLMEWLPHPIFSPSGAWYFWRGLLSTFWRGEIYWGGWKPIASPGMDVLYALLSLLVLAIGTWLAVRNRVPWALFAVGLFLSGVAFMAVLSMAYDFGACPNPSRADPFFVSGRLISGALIPFVLLFVWSLDHQLERWGARRLFLPIMGLLCLAVTVNEALLHVPVFQSSYNWFHL
jgi:hypothetical protein